MQKSVVVLDRDGVINIDSDEYVKSAEEWVPIAGSIEAIARLSSAGLRVAIATNQSGLGRGLFDEAALTAMHSKMLDLIAKAGGQVEGIFYCPHHPDEGCDCRKPAPGLMRQIEAALHITAEQAWFVGDTDKDIKLALATGAEPILVRTGKGESMLASGKIPEQVTVVDDLSAAAELMLRYAAD